MNDNDIIKALECCGNQMYSCTDKRCKAKTLGEAHDLIIRQKAEIERLRDMVAQNEGVLPRYERFIKAEAFKEFAEKISKIFERYSHVHNYAEKAKRCTIETDEGTSIELVSVWDAMELKKHEMVDYETMNELQDNIETISKERLLSELEKDFRLLVKETTEGEDESDDKM